MRAIYVLQCKQYRYALRPKEKVNDVSLLCLVLACTSRGPYFCPVILVAFVAFGGPLSFSSCGCIRAKKTPRAHQKAQRATPMFAGGTASAFITAVHTKSKLRVGAQHFIHDRGHGPAKAFRCRSGRSPAGSKTPLPKENNDALKTLQMATQINLHNFSQP